MLRGDVAREALKEVLKMIESGDFQLVEVDIKVDVAPFVENNWQLYKPTGIRHFVITMYKDPNEKLDSTPVCTGAEFL